ncbi:hypothetical protein ASF30_10245 [Leifsonia sp. Leaf264]|nr:hypothetical protein ASF30_10245 [Leifsonia sp. Leaf264]
MAALTVAQRKLISRLQHAAARGLHVIVLTRSQHASSDVLAAAGYLELIGSSARLTALGAAVPPYSEPPVDPSKRYALSGPALNLLAILGDGELHRLERHQNHTVLPLLKHGLATSRARIGSITDAGHRLLVDTSQVTVPKQDLHLIGTDHLIGQHRAATATAIQQASTTSPAQRRADLIVDLLAARADNGDSSAAAWVSRR